MDPITLDGVEALIQAQPGVKVSVYIPTHRVDGKTEEDIIRLKNALESAQTALVGAGMRPPEAQELLAPGRALLSNEEYRQAHSDGLALLISDVRNQRFRSPRGYEPLTPLGGIFHIKPLLPLTSQAGRCFILALSLDEVRLMGGNEYPVDDIQVDETPAGIGEALRYNDP